MWYNCVVGGGVMDIKFPLMSILSVAFLAFFLVQGGDVELHSIEVGFSANVERITITVDPAIVVWSDFIYPSSWLGETFGNVAVVNRKYQGTHVGEYIKRFETNHIKQFYALGWWSYPAGLFLPIDPALDIVHWDDTIEPDRAEWLPLRDFVPIWHFIHFSMLR